MATEKQETGAAAAHNEDGHDDHVEKLKLFSAADAQHANTAEHNLTFWQAIKSNKKAAMWSMIISMAIVMEG